jgi:similar to stage IV sporulation protein
VRVRVEGLSLEKLITRAAAEGIRLRRVERVTPRALLATVRGADLRALERIAETVGWRVTVQGESALRRSQGLLARRTMLACGVLVFLAGVWLADTRVWFVRIEGAGESAGEVRAVLEEQGARPGQPRAALDTQVIRRALERRLPRVAWVDVDLRGVTLTITCVPARMPEPAAYGGEPVDVVAARDGIVAGLTVYAGIAEVKVGDAVRRGQVLVRGEERTADGAMRPVAARAEVLSRVWYTGGARIPATENVATPTGSAAERTLLCTPWLRWSDAPPPDYAEQDVDVHRQVIGGIFVPVWVQRERYEEVTLSLAPRPQEALERESAAAAERIAREKMPFRLRILDKWVEYSMIKEDHFSAEVVLEALEDIAQSGAPLSSPAPAAE